MRFVLAFMAVAVLAFSAPSSATQVDGAVNVYPDQAVRVPLSATGINHIICDDGVWTADAKVDMRKSVAKFEKATASEIIAAFKWREKDGAVEYRKMETDIHLFCDGERYVVIGVPSDVLPVFVHLTAGPRSAAQLKGPLTEEITVAFGNMVYLRKPQRPLKARPMQPLKVNLFEELELWWVGSYEAPGVRFDEYEGRYTGKGTIHPDADDLMEKLGNAERALAITMNRWQLSAEDDEPVRIIVANTAGKVRNAK